MGQDLPDLQAYTYWLHHTEWKIKSDEIMSRMHVINTTDMCYLENSFEIYLPLSDLQGEQ